MAWFGSVGGPEDPLDDRLSISVLTVAELRQGVITLEPGRRRASLEQAVDVLVLEYAKRILPVDLAVIDRWQAVAVANRRAGRTVGFVDELIAATALAHGLTLVTRNVRHFETSGCRVLSPWSQP